VRIFVRQCRSLAAAGNEVVLLCTNACDEEVEGVKIKTVGKPIGRFDRMIRTTWRIFLAARAERADLYVIHDPELIPFAWILGIRSGVAIYDMHENTPKQILTKEWIPPFLRLPTAWALSALERILLRRMPVVFAESSYQHDYRYLRQATTVLNMPFVGKNVAKNSRPTVGYMGGVSPLRGSLVTIDALDRLKKKDIRPDFECIGPLSAAHASELCTRAEALQPAEVRVRGYMLPDEGWKLMARCHIGLAVLKNVPNYVESFPGKMFEYMSFGVPVVVSNFPLYREIVDRIGCGICVDPESPDELADAIEWLLTHPQEALLMGKRGKAAVENEYNWDKEFEKLLDFYDECLQSRGIRVLRDSLGLRKLLAA